MKELSITPLQHAERKPLDGKVILWIVLGGVILLVMIFAGGLVKDMNRKEERNEG